MKNFFTILIISISFLASQESAYSQISSPSDYLDSIKIELQKEWPGNRTINLVFHGHSVPAGYFRTPIVNSLDAYPQQVLKQLKEMYPLAVINVIVTAIGGENSISGIERFGSDVLIHKPDVLFIDYALNDIGPGLEKAKEAWSKMIVKAKRENIRIILLTPSPDQRVDILDQISELEQHSNQIRSLAADFEIGLADSYKLFHQLAASGESIPDYMSQVNHPNKKGHLLIANEIMKYFR